MGAVQGVVQVLDVQVDLKAGLVVALDHHGGLGVHHGGTGQAALDGLEDQLGVHTGLLGQGQGLGHGLDVAGHHDLVGQLGGVARAHVAAQDHGSAHGLQHGLEAVKDLLLAAHHEGQGAVDGLGLAAGDGGVQHLDVLLGQLRGDLLRGHGVDGAHVDKGGAGAHVGGHAVLAQHDGLHLGAVGDHGHHQVAGLADLVVGGGLGAAGDDLVHGGLIQVVDSQVIAGLQHILGHGLAHDAQSDQSDLHKKFLLTKNT